MDSLNKQNTSLFKTKKKAKKPKQKTTNFIEALKDLGSSIKKQSKDATLGMGKSAADQLLGQGGQPQQQKGEIKPNQPFNFEDYLKSREREIEAQQKQRFEKRLRQERMVYHYKQEEAKIQVKSIQKELQKLAEETQGLSQEVKKAVFEGMVEPGTYHQNFLERIKTIIELARKKVAESRTWLHLFSKRKKQQGHYWAQVKKSGTKYMLSQERYMVTQTG